jgi:hypothetical protein
MLLFMTDVAGRMRVAQVVRAVMGWKGITVPQLAALPGRPQLTTIERVRAGDTNVSDTMLRAIGGKLRLPSDFLLYVETRDVDKIRTARRGPDDDDLIRWTIDLIESGPDEQESG